MHKDQVVESTLEHVRAIAMNNMKCIMDGQHSRLRELYSDDAHVWHSYDGTYKPFSVVLGPLELLAAKAKRISYEDLDLYLREDGWVQEHVAEIELRNSETIRIPAVIVVRLDADRKIKSLKEYIDGAEIQKLMAAIEAVD